jgi:glycosyltransferase-like protein LARGE
VALENAVTDFALMLDADFIPSPNTHNDILHQLTKFDLKHNKVAFVVPAFEREIANNETVTIQDLPLTKEALTKVKGKRGKLFIFHRSYYRGHGPTRYRKWYQTNTSFRVKYRMLYEPYLVVYRAADNFPRFYEPLAGFGRNKQSWVEELAAAQYEFHVLPDSFLIHINHHHGRYLLGSRMVNEEVYSTYLQFQRDVAERYQIDWPPKD